MGVYNAKWAGNWERDIMVGLDLNVGYKSIYGDGVYWQGEFRRYQSLSSKRRTDQSTVVIIFLFGTLCKQQQNQD